MKVVTDSDFTVYSEGITVASVCSSLPTEEVEARMKNVPTGVGEWFLSENKFFASGESNPTPCNHAPKTHTHYLFNC